MCLKLTLSKSVFLIIRNTSFNIFVSWFQGLTEEQLGLVNDLFEWLVDPCLYFIRKNCRTFIQTSDMHLVQSLMHLYTCLMDEIIHTLEQVPAAEGDEPQHDHGLTNQQVRYLGPVVQSIVSLTSLLRSQLFKYSLSIWEGQKQIQCYFLVGEKLAVQKILTFFIIKQHCI